MAPCARCGYEDNDGAVCGRCGVILAKARPPERRTEALPASLGPLPAVRVRISPRQGIAIALLAVGLWQLWGIGWRPWHLMPRANAHDASPIDLQREPDQETYATPRKPRVLRVRGRLVLLEPRARYRLAGRIVAEDQFYTDLMAPIAPTDLTLAWGPMLAPEMAKKIKFGHFQRFGSWQMAADSPIDLAVVTRHVSNNHLIPATDRVAAALAALSVGDEVELSGELVDVSMTGGGIAGEQLTTSRTRDDAGAGACEIIYVTQVRLGERVWY